LGLFFLMGPYSALLFFVGESFPTAIRGTGAAIINAMGPIGAVMAGFGATAMLNAGSDWRIGAALWGHSVRDLWPAGHVLQARQSGRCKMKLVRTRRSRR
jgi:hypothetical protein